MGQVTGHPEPGIQGVVASMLKFQGVKLSEDGAASAHSHGHLSVGTEDLTVCTSRVHETVVTCLRRVGAERVAQDADSASPLRPKLMGRLSFGGRRGRAKAAEDATAWDTPSHK